MIEPKRTKRRILTAGVGIAAFTALEGLACGNPVAPRCPSGTGCVPQRDAAIDAPVTDAGIDAMPDATPDAP